MNENLKPDEMAMLERAEKASGGPWEPTVDPVDNDVHIDCPDGHTATVYLSEGLDDEPPIQDLANAKFIAAARTDLPTILARLANERAKLAIAIDAMGRAATELSREVPPQYAGTDREGLPIEVEHSSVEMACGMASMDLATALARINELEKQS